MPAQRGTIAITGGTAVSSNAYDTYAHQHQVQHLHHRSQRYQQHHHQHQPHHQRHQRQPLAPEAAKATTTSEPTNHLHPPSLHQRRQGHTPKTIINNTLATNASHETPSTKPSPAAPTPSPPPTPPTPPSPTTSPGASPATPSPSASPAAYTTYSAPSLSEPTGPASAHPGTETAHARTQATDRPQTDPHRNQQQRLQHHQHQRDRRP